MWMLPSRSACPRIEAWLSVSRWILVARGKGGMWVRTCWAIWQGLVSHGAVLLARCSHIKGLLGLWAWTHNVLHVLRCMSCTFSDHPKGRDWILLNLAPFVWMMSAVGTWTVSRLRNWSLIVAINDLLVVRVMTPRCLAIVGDVRLLWLCRLGMLACNHIMKPGWVGWIGVLRDVRCRWGGGTLSSGN
jgi:hypothetical protein